VESIYGLKLIQILHSWVVLKWHIILFTENKKPAQEEETYDPNSKDSQNGGYDGSSGESNQTEDSEKTEKANIQDELQQYVQSVRKLINSKSRKNIAHVPKTKQSMKTLLLSD